MKRQAVVNAGVTFRFRNEKSGKFEVTDFKYENGIIDYVAELAERIHLRGRCSLNRAPRPRPGVTSPSTR